MSEETAFWAAKRLRNKAKRHANLASADPTDWHQHTPYHWSRDLKGHRLDYWPSTRKWQYQGRVLQGDINAFIAREVKTP